MRASSPARADSRMIGTVRSLGSARSSWIRPKPSRPGIITSETTSAGGCARAAASASMPSDTATTS